MAQAGHSGSRKMPSLASMATVAGVAISLLAAAFTLDQIRVAEQQNRVAEEESLTTLVAEITHEARALTGANEEQQSAIKQARLGDAEEAFALVGRLHEQAPAIDNYEIGLAFKEEDEDDKAIISFARAGSVTGSPHFRSAALLQEAALLFEMGGQDNVIEARRDAQLAAHAYDGQPYATPYVIDYNRAAGALFDANRDLPNCSRALRSAQQAISGERVRLMEIASLRASLKVATERC
jgi:hypothetical protein